MATDNTNAPNEPDQGIELLVSFCGELHRVETTGTLTFGRTADLEIDDNPFLHRHLGLLFYRSDSWWLKNVGTQIPIVIADTESTSHISVSSGSEVPLPFKLSTVSFTAARNHYELEMEIRSPLASTPTDDPTELTGTPTVTIGAMTLNEEQTLLLLALALPRLREPHRPDLPLPSSQDVATRLGWSITKYNRKLDYLCEKFERSGLRGLRGERAGLAVQRRQLLVRYAVEAGLVSVEKIPSSW
jgi:hypothetical protein